MKYAIDKDCPDDNKVNDGKDNDDKNNDDDDNDDDDSDKDQSDDDDIESTLSLISKKQKAILKKLAMQKIKSK